MQFLLDLLGSIANAGDTVTEFFKSIPDYFGQLVVWGNAWYVKLKFLWLIYSLELAYKTAEYLLNDIGFNDMLASFFNALPDEIRYYAFIFKIPQAIGIYFNCLATAFVWKITRF
ncbi:DUF2523 domain-containing protein [Vibrio cholerae]|nr:DUF2523 domain-containing protein [Vibrio cholerae]